MVEVSIISCLADSTKSWSDMYRSSSTVHAIVGVGEDQHEYSLSTANGACMASSVLKIDPPPSEKLVNRCRKGRSVVFDISPPNVHRGRCHLFTVYVSSVGAMPAAILSRLG